MQNRTIFGLMQILSVTLVLIIGEILPADAKDLPEFQKLPITLNASEQVPKNILTGPNYRIEANVINDGLIDIYRLTTDYGPLKVESTSLLRERTNELKALSHMEAVEQTDTFAKALEKGATAPIAMAKGLVTHPVDTVSGIASGVGSWFKDIGNAITSDDPNQEGAISAAIGYAAAKRKMAYEYGINPYTRYEPVQDKLNNIARASVVGGLTPKVAFGLIKTPVGTVLQVTDNAETMRQLVRDKSPAELDEINNKKLNAMGVEESTAKEFLKNPYFDPQEETLLVGELEAMKNVKDRKNFIKMAAVAPDYKIVRYLRERAQMMAVYNEKVAPVDRVVAVQGVPLLQRKDGVIVLLAPLDHVFWTHHVWLTLKKGSEILNQLPGFSGKEVWISGAIDPIARKALEMEGWKVKEDFASTFLTEKK
ncbi:hypothetical protein D1AOALGA4SA_10517 [Olavius algarvensis Delta 1 endosymbiont]|nr:hypothetical protein D1AOALGA4SA_10517 [Olavius algarvensis Delta 1 endosymbiont]